MRYHEPSSNHGEVEAVSTVGAKAHTGNLLLYPSPCPASFAGRVRRLPLSKLVACAKRDGFAGRRSSISHKGLLRATVLGLGCTHYKQIQALLFVQVSPSYGQG